MTLNELIQELSKLQEQHGDEKLMVGSEKLKADMGIGGIDNALVIWLHAGPFAQLAIRGLPQPITVTTPSGREYRYGPEPLPQPQEPVKGHETPTCASCRNFICSGWCQEELFSDGTKPISALDKDL